MARTSTHAPKKHERQTKIEAFFDLSLYRFHQSQSPTVESRVLRKIVSEPSTSVTNTRRSCLHTAFSFPECIYVPSVHILNATDFSLHDSMNNAAADEMLLKSREREGFGFAEIRQHEKRPLYDFHSTDAENLNVRDSAKLR